MSRSSKKMISLPCPEHNRSTDPHVGLATADSSSLSSWHFSLFTHNVVIPLPKHWSWHIQGVHCYLQNEELMGGGKEKSNEGGREEGKEEVREEGNERGREELCIYYL